MKVEETVMAEKLVSFKPIPVFRYEDTERTFVGRELQR